MLETVLLRDDMVAELIAEEEDYLRYRIKEEFFTAKSPDISIREFSNLMKNL